MKSIQHEDNFCQIPLTQGYYALVDTSDYKMLAAYNWYAIKDNNLVYAARHQKTKDNKNGAILMHRMIINPPTNLKIDHRNHNGLDNRHCNLRLATHVKNIRNSRKRIGTVSAFKGVDIDHGRWRARIRVMGKEIYLGTFDSETDAAIAYNKAAKKYFDDFAFLNTFQKEK